MEATNGTAISVKDLHMRYGQNEAVRGISFEVNGGEVFGFLGPNGAGKTTTIEILEGYKRTDGDVSVLGTDPGHPTREWRERIGLVLQEWELDPTLTVRELVTLFSQLWGGAASLTLLQSSSPSIPGISQSLIATSAPRSRKRSQPR
jgi:ABC-2 type transport system ATP-binding protein